MKPLFRVATSTFLLTTLLLVAFDFSLAVLNPLKRVSDLGLSGLNYYYVVAKLPQYMASPQKADVVLTGSSLWLYPSVRTEDDFAGNKTRYDAPYVCQRIDECSTSRYFESLLPGRHQVANLGTAGALMSDQYCVLKRLVGCAKKPSLLICDLSPREFLDNNQPDPVKTPVYLVLSDMTGIGDILAMGRDFSASCDYLFGAASNCFRSRRDLRLFVVNFAAGLAARPASLLDGKPAKKLDLTSITHPAVIPVYTPPVGAFQTDLLHYKKMYLPINPKSRDTQMRYFRQYLELAKKEHIPVLCVWMPLPQANLALLPKDELAQITAHADKLATEYGATVYRPTEPYGNEDFEDAAHMNLSGGKKLFKELAVAAASLLPPQR